MNFQPPQSDANERPADTSVRKGSASSHQRRQLLRAVGASGALVGVGLPFAAHATGRPHCNKNNQNYHATASAVGSMVGSVSGTTPPVVGRTCSHYRTNSNWPATCNNGKGRNLSYSLCADATAGTKLRFWHVFELSNPGAASPKYRYCADILNNYSTSDEAHWLTAVFNANKCSPFSYTPSDVVDLYIEKNPAMGGQVQAGLNAKALTLFRDYLSSQP